MTVSDYWQQQCERLGRQISQMDAERSELRTEAATLRAALEAIRLRVSELRRKEDSSAARDIEQLALAATTGQAVPVEVDPVEALLAVECPADDCRAAVGRPCLPNASEADFDEGDAVLVTDCDMFCADRIRRASSTTTRAR